MTKIKLNFETSRGQLAKQLEKTNEDSPFSFGLDCNLAPDFIAPARSPKEACWVTGGRRGLHSSQVYTTRKSRVWSVRWLPTYCQAVGFNQSTEKCVYVGEKCKKKLPWKHLQRTVQLQSSMSEQWSKLLGVTEMISQGPRRCCRAHSQIFYFLFFLKATSPKPSASL